MAVLQVLIVCTNFTCVRVVGNMDFSSSYQTHPSLFGIIGQNLGGRAGDLMSMY